MKIPYARQHIDEQDVDAVIQALRSDWLTQGPALPRFEEKVSNYCGAKCACAVANGTAALHLACLALGLKAGDILWTTPISFVASANCALYCGASVDFVDIDPRTYNMSVARLEKKLEKAKKEKKLPKIVIPVHLTGQSCEMKPIFELSKKYGFKIIEDASHAMGGSYLKQKVGSCAYSDCVVFSFHAIKIITTGEGGMVVTNDKNLHAKVARLRTHGITRAPEEMILKNPAPWYYEQQELGFNYRMTDIQAALGYSQMNRVDEFVRRRREIAARYNQLLSDLPLVLPFQYPDTQSSYHLYVIRLQTEKIQKTHRQIFEALREKGIGVNLHYMPIYLQPHYQQLGFQKNLCSEAEKYYSASMSLPMYYGLSNEQQDFVVQTLKNEIL
ncbi:MAG: UDP-4-amino-4,6-dideoxy-N-acetyl-beta-L-altrosamine transaminase [Verrucomicrobiota bacterium]